jgi:hypothetical protein
MTSAISSVSKSTSFYVVCPSNTQVDGNRTNSFRVRLPRKLHFHSQWSVGLAVLVFPNTWPSLGTTDEQFIRVIWQTGAQLQIPIPSASMKNPTELVSALNKAIVADADHLAQRLEAANKIWEEADTESKLLARKLVWPRFIPSSSSSSSQQQRSRKSGQPEASATAETSEREILGRADVQQMLAEETERILAERLSAAQLNEMDVELVKSARLHGGAQKWVDAYRTPEHYCKFGFDVDRQRFRLRLEKDNVQCMELSAQLAYMLGFADTRLDSAMNVARYMPDMRGGVSSFFVYAPDLIEPVFIGDVAAPVLRMVNIRGQADEIVEECYPIIQYHRLIKREFQEMFFEIRAANTKLMPFQYGTCTLTLHFKKNTLFLRKINKRFFPLFLAFNYVHI